MNAPFFMWFYKESYWYNWRFQGLCGSRMNNTGTNRDLMLLDSVDIFKSKLKAHLFGLAYHYFLCAFHIILVL
jgi:hypothetical protein